MQIGPCRSFRYREHFPDLRVPKPFDIVQHDHRPLTLRQPLESRAEAASQLIRFRRIVERQRHRLRQRSGRPHLSAPLQIERRIGDDAMQPRTERLARNRAKARYACRNPSCTASSAS